MMKVKYDYKNILIFSSMVFIVSLVITIFAWAKIPADAQIPIHWNAQGEVDNYGDKTFGLLIGPGIILLLTVLLAFVPRMEPRIENLKQSQRAYKFVWGFIVLFMAVLHVVTTLAAMGAVIEMTTIMAVIVGVLFMVIGNFMGKIRSNFMFGIRTPWTLSNETAWNKTHRLGGWLFFLIGLLVLLSGFFASGELTFGLLMIGVFLSLPILFGYSYWVWKQDEGDKSAS